MTDATQPRYRSENERVAHRILQDMFPNTRIIHDYHIGSGLKVDFVVLSTVKIGLELDGAQHFGYSKYFHNSVDQFWAQKKRDKTKDFVSKQHGITLVRVDARKGVTKEAVQSAIAEAMEIGYIEPVDPEAKWKEIRRKQRKEFRDRMKNGK